MISRTLEPSIKPIVRGTVVDAVTEQLRVQILSGGFRPGSRLPPERELAERLGVNRLTLRAGLGRLEALGLIVIQHGTGSVVRDYREHGGIETLAKLLSVTRDEDPPRHLALARDVLELRRVLTAEAVALAAERRTPADLSAMREAAAAQARSVRDPVAFARGDLVFARAVVRAARNLGFELLLNTIARVPDEHPALARAMYPHPRRQAPHYAAIIGLIEAGDAAFAREATRVALEALDRVTLARVARTARVGDGHSGGKATVTATRTNGAVR